MNPLSKSILAAIAIVAVNSASAQQVCDFTLDDHTIYTVPVSAMRVTTVSFPSPLAAMDGALTTADGKTPGLFQIAHTKGTSYFSVRALAKDAVTNVNVRWNQRTYVFELRESTEPCYSMIMRAANERSAAVRPLTPNRLLGLLDKAKAFPLLRQYQPDAVRNVEVRDLRSDPWISDCGDYEVRCVEAMRFPEQDTLVFQLSLTNRTPKPLVHTPEKMEIRVGEHTLTPTLTDICGALPPGSTSTGYVAVACSTDAHTKSLSLKNEFTFLLARRDPAVEAVVHGFEEIQCGGLSK